MKQFQFAYENMEDLRSKLLECDRRCKKLNSKKAMIQIFNSTGETETVDKITALIEEILPYAEYIGCSTDDNVMFGKSSSTSITMTFAIFEDPSSKVEVVQLELEELSVEKLGDTFIKLHTDRPWLKAVEVIIAPKCVMEGNFTNLFFSLKTSLCVFGGGGFGKIDPMSSVVFSKHGKASNGALVMVLFGGEALHFKSTSVTGWRPLGQRLSITKSHGNILQTLNGTPAVELYTKYLNIKNDEYFQDNAIEFPILCRTKDGYEILRDPVSANPDGSVTMFSEVDVFESVRLSYGDRRNIMESIREVAEEICEFKPDGIMLFSCIARKAFWGEDIDRESAMFQYIAPTFGFYTSGEIMSQGGVLHHFNETLVIAAIREGDAEERPLPVLPEKIKDKGISLNSRLVNFIATATTELEQKNNDLDKMITTVEESRSQAEQANRAKSEFLANMSHEIRTPINAILGFDTMILREGVDEGIAKYATDIMRAGTNLLTIINDILDLSKIESGKMEIIPVEYEPASVILDIRDMMKLKANEKGLEFCLDVDKNLPSVLFGDNVRIRQVIINLLTNAIKYTEKGKVTLSISVSKVKSNALIHFEIKDTGIGIKPEDMDKLFEKFRRIEEQRTHAIEGTGLGMNITVNLLRKMNSKLEVNSEYGKGSTFSFDIEQKILKSKPIGDIEKCMEKTEKATLYTAPFIAVDTDVLIVDDNAMNRQVIISLLQQTGINFDEADGGYSAVEMTGDKHYDLILMDHMMPDLDGVQAMHRIKESLTNKNSHTPIICMTANAITGAQEDYLWQGFDAYLSKPVNPDTLEKLLADYLPAEKLQKGMIIAPTKRPNEEQSIEGLPEIDGLDMKIAIKNLNTKELVLKTIEVFYESSPGEASELEGYLKTICEAGEGEDISEALDKYRIKVHAMKSTSATIGATMVSSLAKFLEYSARDHKTDRIKNITGAFLEEWRALTERIKAVVCKSSDGTEAKLEPDPQKVETLLKKLNNALKNMDIDTGDELMAELRRYDFPGLIKVLLNELESAVININLEAVERITESITDLL